MYSNLLTNLDALLITNLTNIRYLTGFVGASNNECEAYVLVTKNKTYLFTNSLYLEQAKKLNCEIIEISRENPLANKLKEVLESVIPGLPAGRTGSRLGGRDDGIRTKLGFEEANLTVAEFNALKKELNKVAFVSTQNRVEKLRMVKRPDEIANIRYAARLTDECFSLIIKMLKPGVTESEIAWEIEAFFRKRGAELAFSPIVAFGKNTSQPHYSISQGLDPGNQGLTLEQDDIVLLDFGARINGYCSDMTRVIFIGKPKDEWLKAYEAVLEAQQSAIDYLNKNRSPSGAEADKIARSIIKKAGFPTYPHSLGHNIGLDIHEEPRLIRNKDEVLSPGMVFSVEPGIYLEGQFGIRIEDLALLSKNGMEILTKSRKKPVNVI